MYSNIKSIQIIVALLKDYDIRDIVLSPGGSDIPLIHSVENDPFFTCYSVVDERSAAYFAMGVAQQKNRPVACVCTSGTAVSNYLPGITEAYYQSVPVLAITADKNPYYQDQLEIQKINQENIFNNVVKKSVSLPWIQCEDDEWLCNRLVNEALLELNHHGTGPVQINVPIIGATHVYDCKELHKQRKIDIVPINSENDQWNLCMDQLRKCKKIMVVVGQNITFDKEDIDNMNKFFEKYNCIFAVETLSNLRCNGTIHTYPVTEMIGEDVFSSVSPDIVISVGNNLSAYNLKTYLRKEYKTIQNWLVSEKGCVRDAYKCLTHIFECSVKQFFKKIIELSDNSKSNNTYYNSWKDIIEKISLPELGFTNFRVGQELSKIIPEGSILHCAILNSTRMMQYYPLASNVKVYSNVGALGIDGCFSTFAGQAASTNGLAFLLIGDLSFFYDMNAAGLASIGKNVRVIMMNNGGGSEFHFFMGKKNISTIDKYICAEHCKTAEGWIRSLGYQYFSAKSAEELIDALNKFGKSSDTPMFLEVFTKMESDAVDTRKMYNEAKQKAESSSSVKGFAKGLVKSILSERTIDKVKKKQG